MIKLCALGVLDLRTAANEELRQVLAQPKRAALLTYLVLATPRGSHPRDQLLAMFWPDQAPEPARNALSQATYFLRRALGDDVIVSNGDSLAVAPAAIWCDALAFEAAIQQGRLDEALELYRGDLLEGFHVANAPELERWLDAVRQRFGERYGAALEAAASECERRGDFAAAVRHRRRLAARDPCNSSIALRLMRALAASGDAAAAIRHAMLHEKLLRSEFDIALPPDISGFVAELQAPPAVPPARPRPAPAPVAEPSPGQGPSQTLGGRAPPSPVTPWRARRARVAMVTAAFVTACVGVAYALATRDPSADAQLQELYRRGQLAEVNRSQVGLQTAIQYYRTAIARDSTFALAYAALSQAYGRLAHYDYAPKAGSLDSARVLAQQAVRLDSMLPESRTAMAVSLANSGHFEPAAREVRRAIELGPDNADAHAWYGMLLTALGKGREALAEGELALKLDPLGPRVAHTVITQATFLVTGKRPHRRLPAAERRPFLQREPGEPWGRAQQALERADDGDCEAARSDISEARRLVSDSNMVMLAFTGMVYWSCNQPAEARALLGRMKQRSRADEHAVRVAMLHARMGEPDSAFVWLQRHHWIVSEVAMLRAAPWFDTLRADPSLAQVIRRLGVQ